MVASTMFSICLHWQIRAPQSWATHQDSIDLYIAYILKLEFSHNYLADLYKAQHIA